jgi:predicted MarR family transcription regulator
MTDQDPSQPYKRADQLHKRIVSSSYFVSKKALELSEVKYGLIVASNAFGTWMIKAMSVVLAEVEQSADLGVLDILCLHSVNHRGRAKKLADICFKLNVEDSHTVNCALNKLVKTG